MKLYTKTDIFGKKYIGCTEFLSLVRIKCTMFELLLPTMWIKLAT